VKSTVLVNWNSRLGRSVLSFESESEKRREHLSDGRKSSQGIEMSLMFPAEDREMAEL
jgi:hypothetical protein